MTRQQVILGVVALLLAVACAACQPIVAPEESAEESFVPPSRVLFLGNSLTGVNGGIDRHLQGLVDAANPDSDIVVDSWIMLGATLAEITEHPYAIRAIEEGFDVVVLQGDAMGEAADPEQFLAAASALDQVIKENGAKTALFLLWETPEYNDFTLEDYLQSHRIVAKALDAQLIPVGLAFARVEEEHPEIVLQMWDGHETLHGNYLAAAVFYASLFGENPQGLTYIPDPSWAMAGDPNITPEQAAILQQAAWETVQEFDQ
jgi:hypothetical protein